MRVYIALSYISSRWGGLKARLRRWREEKREKRERARQAVLEKGRVGKGGSGWRVFFLEDEGGEG